MAGNLYDDALEALDDQAPAAADNPYLETLDGLETSRTRAMRTAQVQATTTTPDRAADVSKLSRATGLAPDVVERNYDDLSRQVKVESTPYSSIQTQSPALAEWASDPANAAAAHDDMEQLGLLEWIVTAPAKAFAQSTAQMRLGALRSQQLFRDLTPEERDQLNAEKFASTKDGEIGAANSWFRGAVTGTSQFLANTLFGLKSAAPQMAIGASVGAVIGGAGGSLGGGAGAVPGALAGAKWGAEVGGLIGGGMFSFQLEAGLAYDEFLDFKVGPGEAPLDPDAAKAAAIAAGVLNAGLEVGALEVVLKTIPGLSTLGKKGTKEAIKAALRNPTIRAGLASAVKEYAGALTAETAVEVGQRAITILAGELGKYATGTGGALKEPGDILEELVQEGEGAVQSFALGLAVGPGFGIAHKARQAQRAQRSEAFFKALADGVTGSKLVERLPDAAQAFLERATKDGPIANVYAPVEPFREYWQSQGLDPAEVAAELTGRADAYETALQHGEDLVIPTARYAVKLAGTEHHKFFADELRLGPDEMNAREGKAFQEEVKAAQAQAAEDAKAGKLAELTPRQQVRQQVMERLQAAGVPLATAETYADSYEGAFGSLLDRAGLDPVDFYRQYGLVVDRPDLASSEPKLSATQKPSRNVKPAATFLGYGPSGPLYNIIGGPANRSTVGVDRLAELGIAVPETPPDSGEKLTGEQLRARAIAAQAAPPAELLGEGGYAGPERRQEAGTGPDGVDRRNEPMDFMSNVGAAAARLRSENPNADRDAAALQARAKASRAPAPPRAIVDNIAPGAQTEGTNGAETATGEELPGDDPQSLETPQDGEHDGGGESADLDAGASERIPPSARPYVAELTADARERGYRGTDDTLAARFLEHYERAQTIAADLEEIENDTSWRSLLVAIAKIGGLGIEAEGESGQAGELRWMMESLSRGPGLIKKGKRAGKYMPLNAAGIDGAPNIIRRKGGLSIDRVRESLQQDPQWAHFNDINDLMVALEDAVTKGNLENNHRDVRAVSSAANVYSVLSGFYGVKPGADWWIEAPGDLLNEEDILESDANAAAADDSSFNVEEFNQGLFDELEPIHPTADILTTGEVQPRLPGAEEVREQEVSTPELEAPFSLTSEVSQRKGKQTTLFQPAYHGTPHTFEQFSLHAMGSGEGAQAYGWGLYFASARAVADGYRERLAGKPKPAQLAIDGVRVYEVAKGAMMQQDAEGNDVLTKDLRMGLMELYSRSHWVQPGREWIPRMRQDLQQTIKNLEAAQRAGAPLIMEIGDSRDNADDVRRTLEREKYRLQDAQSALRALEHFGDKIEVLPAERPGRTFTVEIPDDGDYLLWDKPASEQSPKVQAALKALGLKWADATYPAFEEAVERIEAAIQAQRSPGIAGYRDVSVVEGLREGLHHAQAQDRTALNAWYDGNKGLLGDFRRSLTGEEAYRAVGQKLSSLPGSGAENAQKASQTLAAAGIPGIKYLDGISRGTGAGSYNFVIFDDELVQVTEYDQSIQELTPDGLAEWVAGMREKYGEDLVDLDVQLTNDGDLEAVTLAIARGAQRAGLGTQVMQELTRFADQQGKRIVLSPAEKGYAPAGAGQTTSYARLVKFYQRFGFVRNAGRHKDFSTLAAMYREPTVSLSSLTRPPAVAGKVTETPAFQKWFGESKVVNEDGEPLVVYHGSHEDIAAYDPAKAPEGGFHFGTTGQQAGTRIFKAGANIQAVYLSIQNPRRSKDSGQSWRSQIAAAKKAGHDGIVYLNRYEGIPREAFERAQAKVGRPGETLEETLGRLSDEKFRQLIPEAGDSYIAFRPEQIKSAMGNRGTFDPANGNILDQQTTGGRRGSIRFGADRQMTISLFERADLSTFLHESGHFFLEVFGDVFDKVAALDPATLTDKQRVLLADYGAILKHLGVDDRSKIGEAQHEIFARSFEAYLMTGKAPSLELRTAFAKYRAWLVGIYRTLKNLNVNLTKEVTQVFDRMLATDRAIAEATAVGQVAPMFLTAEAAGMSDADFALYRAKVEDASRTARETLERRILSEVQREQEQLWKDQRAAILAEVAAAVHEQPVYRAIAAMQRGTNPDGTPLEEGLEPTPIKLSKRILVDRYGADRLKRLPKPYIYSVDGGLDPDVIAELFGFSSGDAMLTAVEQAPAMKAVIDQQTDARMLAEHGSILLDGTLQEQAQGALSSEDQEIVIRAELRALGQLRRTVKPFVAAERAAGKDALSSERRERAYERRWFEAEKKLEVAIAAGRKQVEIDALTEEVQNLRAKARGGAATIRAAIPPADAMRDAAKERIARTRVRDLNPAGFWSASRRAAQKALAHAARQEFDAAITAKQQELLNLALYREATRAKDDAATRVRKARDLAKPATRASLGLAGGTYLDQIDGILDRFEFATVSRKVLDRRASLRKWIEGIEGEGLPVDLPEHLVEEALRVNYQELTIEELVGVTDGLDQIVHLARLKNRLLRDKEGRELDALCRNLADSIRDHARQTQPKNIPGDRRPSEERKRMIADFFGGHRKLASILREMDGFADGGPAWEAIMLPLNEAGAREAEMTAEASRKLAELVDAAYPGAAKQGLYTKILIPAIGASLSRMQRIMVAFNWGNEGNRDRVRRQYGWSDGQVQAILDTLTAGDLRFIQGILDLIDSYWPETEAKQKRVFGVAPEKVEAAPIRAAAGEIRGGYFPLKYDDRLSARAIAVLDLEAANLAKQAAYAQATTKRNHTQARLDRVKLPVRLDFGVMFEHMAQVIHDLSHHEALIDVGRILGHGAVQTAILETHGDLVYKQIRNTVRDVAFGDVPAVNGFERAINHVRAGATVAGLAWNFTTAALQPLGLANSVNRIGAKWVAKGVGRWIRSPFAMVETVAWIEESSAFMRSRARTQQREINEIRNTLGINTGKFGGWIDGILSATTFDHVTRQGIADSYFWMIQQMQRVVDVPTWLGQYEKSLAAGETEARAIALADQAVLDSQGGGQTKDLAQVQRGGPMLKLWTNFYSYFNVVYNQAAETKRRTRLNHPAEVGRAAADYLMLFIVPATLGFAIREALKAGGKDDGKDDDDLAWRLGADVMGSVLGTMLGLREVSGLIAGAYGYEGPAGARAFASLGKLAQQAKQGELDEAFLRSLNDVAGILLHYPAGQAWRTSTGAAAIAEGKTANPGALIAGPPRTTK